MPTLSQREFQEKLSLYLDGQLDAEAAREFTSYLDAHPDAARDLEAYRKMKTVLSGQRKLSPDPAFWGKLTRRLEERRHEQENLLPFPRKYLPAAVAFASVAILAVGLVLYGERSSIFSFLTKKTQEVQTAVQESLLQGSIVPLFAELDRDRVLQYALFGTLPLDDHSDRALRVDETSEQGYRIEMGSTVKETGPRVTVDDFVAEVRASLQQSKAIDSVLEDTRREIESSAFYAENNAIAIDPELTKLNRATLVSIASVLEPEQRRRFDTFLKKHGSSYAVAIEEGQGEWSAKRIPKRKPKARSADVAARSYVVMTPDTFIYTQLELNLREVVLQKRELVRMRQKREENLGRFVQRMRQEEGLDERQMLQGNEGIVVQGGTGYFSIQIHGAIVAGPEDSSSHLLIRRSDQPKIFRHEVGNQARRIMFEYEIRLGRGLDSLVEAELKRSGDLQRQMREQDSLLRMQRRSPGIYVAPHDSIRKRRMF
jgi:hypothetical protein